MQAGIHLDVPSATYFGDPCPRPSLTQTLAKVFINKSPKHGWLAHPRLNPGWEPGRGDGYDKDRIIGDAAHAYVLGRGKQVVVIGHDNFRGQEARQERDAAFDAGRVPILPHHDIIAQEMAGVLHSRIRGQELFAARWAAADSEVVVAAEVEGIWCRAMIDRLTHDRRTVFDYKSGALSVAPHVVAYKLADQGADVQAAMHELLLDTIDPESAGRRQHIFICQENEPPYAITVVDLSEAWLTMGRKKLAMARMIFKSCLAKNEWPTYPQEICVPEYPPGREAAWLKREIEAAA